MPPNGRKRQKSDKKVVKETIHSGHFMVSDIDDSEVHDEDEAQSLVVHESDCDQENSPLPDEGYDFASACKETSKTYTFGPRSSHSISIDASLTKLFECMTLAYSGKLTSPRWKQFKGLKLRLKEKIRLNNIIWRAWHMQFVLRRKPFVCQFASPIDGDTHTKPEAVIIEGTYWKRRVATVEAEYQKWRLFYKDRFKSKSNSSADNMAMDLDVRWPPWSKDSFSPAGSVDEDFIMDFSDTLFSTFNPNQPFDFPNPREIAARAGIADFIQPGLVQLQPSVDDFMDTFEPLQDFLNSRLPPLLEESGELNQVSDILQPPVPQAHDVSSVGHSFRGTQVQNPCTANASKNTSYTVVKVSQQTVPQESDKMAIDSFLSSSNGNSHRQESVSSLNQTTSLHSQVTSLVQSDIQVPCATPANELSIASLLQSPICANATNRTNSSEVNFASDRISSSVQHNKTERTTQSFQPSSVSINSHQTTVNIAPKQNTLIQVARSDQVPLTTFSSRQASGAAVSSQNSPSPEDKSHKLPVFLLDLGNSSHPTIQSASVGSFNIPVHVANISPQLPLLTQCPINIAPSHSDASLKVEQGLNELVCNRGISGKSKQLGENQAFRRHSYATGQQVHSGIGAQLTDINSRRTRLIAPATTSSVSGPSFAVPEIPSKQRARSRSVSSPQCGSPKSFSQPPCQAVSLTDISISPPPQTNFAAQSFDTKSVSLVADSSPLVHGTNATGSAASVLPQNAVLAQLLSSGHSQHDVGQKVAKVSNCTTPASTSPVTIIRSIPTLVTTTTTTQTFVLSSIPIATVAEVSDFQRSLLVGAANQVFGSQTTPPRVFPSPSPSSSGSLTCSTSPALGGVPFEAGAQSTSKTTRPKSDEERVQYKEHRRVCHINAEQKRRCNIKNGFEALHHLLPPMSQNPNMKVSKAALLQKAAEHIRALKCERQQQQEEAEMLKQQIEALNQAISLYQNQLPASGAPVPCQKTNRMKEMFEEYVRQRTFQNWKFWIFSLIIEPLIESYNSNVSTASIDEMCKTILSWLDQHCSLVSLRPGVLNSLRHLSTTTNILSDPSCMPEEATRAVTKKESR